MKTYQELKKELQLLSDTVIERARILDNAQYCYTNAANEYSKKLIECDEAEKEGNEELARLEKIASLRAEIFNLDKTNENYDDVLRANQIQFNFKQGLK